MSDAFGEDVVGLVLLVPDLELGLCIFHPALAGGAYVVNAGLGCTPVDRLVI